MWQGAKGCKWGLSEQGRGGRSRAQDGAQDDGVWDACLHVFSDSQAGSAWPLSTLCPQVFVGLATRQVTGTGFHVHGHFYPTVEREHLDFQVRARSASTVACPLDSVRMVPRPTHVAWVLNQTTGKGRGGARNP